MHVDAPPPATAAELAEQIAYYRARAPEYDEWFERRGRYDHGEAHRAQWEAQARAARAHLLAALPPRAQVLELAPGTGIWTAALLDAGASVDAVDAAPEMVRELRRRVGDRVQVEIADLFAYRPRRTYDAVFFGFFLSHVPAEREAAFLGLVREALRPGGVALFVDSRYRPEACAVDHVLPPASAERLERKLNDGRRFRIVKRFLEPAALAARLETAGFEAAVHSTDDYFVYGVARRGAEATP